MSVVMWGNYQGFVVLYARANGCIQEGGFIYYYYDVHQTNVSV
jgi:hypothetical protein